MYFLTVSNIYYCRPLISCLQEHSSLYDDCSIVIPTKVVIDLCRMQPTCNDH